MTNVKINELIATKVLGWHLYKDAWFDEDNHYKEDGMTFSPSTSIKDAFYVLDRLAVRVGLIIELDNMTSCILYDKITDVQTADYGETTAKAICKTILVFKGVEL